MNETNQTHSPRVPLLDLLRLAAVGGVILYHYGFWGATSHGVTQIALPGLAGIAQYGFLGVPIFFAISGFVIAYSAEGRNAIGFGIARFSRIYPTFVVCMTLTFVVTAVVGAGYFEVSLKQWFANLFIAATLLGQPYIDSAYWSLVIEVIFYAWIAVFIALGWFPRRIDTIIIVWLAITFANELTIDAPIFEKVFIADDSGFFVVGLLIYQHYRGRRDAKLWALSALALGTAIFQAIHKLDRLGAHPQGSYDPNVVAVLCVVSLGVVFLATRIKELPLPRGLIFAIGGITYPLYLLHMQIGYVIFEATAPHRYAATTAIFIIALAVGLAWVIWRFLEPSMHNGLKAKLTKLAEDRGWSSSKNRATVRSS